MLGCDAGVYSEVRDCVAAVIEDDAGQQRVLKSFLSKDGFEVEMVKDAAAGLAALEKMRFHLILIKAVLAGKTGWEAAAEIRSKEEAAGRRQVIPIVGIVNTATAAEEEAKCMAAGMTDVVAKPIKKDALLEKVHASIEKAAAAASVAAGAQASCVRPHPNDKSSKETGPLKVLVADDDAGQRLMLKAMLTRDKHVVDLVGNGSDALKMAGKATYDVILLDGFMPIVNGWEAYREIRKREVETGASTAAVIFGITGTSTGADVDNFQMAGLTDMISKPISRDELRSKIAAAIAIPRTPSFAPMQQQPTLLRAQSQSAAPTSPAGAAASSPRASPAKDKGKAKGGRSVIVCDPDSGQRMVLKMLLTKLGCTVKVLTNGADVIKEAEGSKDAQIDAIFIVTNMPTLSGWDVLAQVRAMAHCSSMPVVAVRTAGATIEDFDTENAAAAEKLGGMAFSASIQKPFDLAVVDGLLARLVPEKPGAQGVPQKDSAGVGKDAGGAKKGSSSKEGSGRELTREGSMRHKDHLRILVVEDHWANQKLLEAMLKQRGHDVRCSENGLEAVNLTSTVEFDLVLMDCNMPVLDGFGATERIRARKGLNEKVPIIAVTANAMKGDRDKCMASGMDDYITKPVQRQKLHEMIAKWTGPTLFPPIARSPTP